MRPHRLAGVHRRRWRHSQRSEAVWPDRVQRRFVADAPDRLWVSDITQHRTGEGWVYAAVVLDVYSRRVVGWSIADHLRTELVIDALDMARWRRKPVGTTVHSDRGTQGGFNRWSQHLSMSEVVDDGNDGLEQEDQRCLRECTSAVACRSGTSSSDALARAA